MPPPTVFLAVSRTPSRLQKYQRSDNSRLCIASILLGTPPCIWAIPAHAQIGPLRDKNTGIQDASFQTDKIDMTPGKAIVDAGVETSTAQEPF